MGHVNTQITLKSIYDVKQAKEGNLPENKIRQATVDVMVDTGATTLVINEQLFQQLGLDVIGEREISLANCGCRRWHISHLLKKFFRYDSRTNETCKVTDALEINWEDRSFTMPALVVDNAPDFLLGVLPLEGMDLVVDTVNQKLVGAHGDHPVYRV